MILRLRALALLVPLIVGACAPPSVAPGQMQAIKRVAVMSAIGDKFTVKKIGFTVFGNEEKDFPIDSWGIDEFVIGKVRGVLAGRLDVRPVAYQKSAFNTTGNNFDKIVEIVRGQATSTDIDAYIIVTKGGSQYASTNQGLYGLGIMEHSALGTAVYLYALYWMTVVDGHKFTVIANTPAFPLSQTVLAMTAIRGPSRELDKSWMPETLGATQNLRLKSAVTELLDRNLPGTIENLKLLQ